VILGIYQFMLVLLINSLMDVLDSMHLAAVGWLTLNETTYIRPVQLRIISVPFTDIDMAATLASQYSKYIIVQCRPRTTDENKILTKNFTKIIEYNAELTNCKNLSQLDFDLLIIDITIPANHLFLEVITPQAKKLGYAIVMLKKTMSNYEDIIKQLECFVISEFEDLEGGHFLQSLLRTKLPKLKSTASHLFSKLSSCLSSASK
jgi:hypothetical protein